ncbi:hypothetical protein AO385_2101 [Moraxella catarrhalis]|uniref:Uncharacterized protein n=1 Tax=Moraxella catarrhalis TaxID=480 RepID=A0A198UJC4_MORCA|nr:hypothetical protein AO385_2101 [Moraxella catarrhalis]OAU95337.1 hypothetical protein AO384_1528 [Moraxella catarrhalis]OAU98281.1 hypothetical protein AO383_0737 [Moraxella catarrhalis]
MIAEKISDTIRGQKLPKSTASYYKTNPNTVRSEPLRAFSDDMLI